MVIELYYNPTGLYTLVNAKSAQMTDFFGVGKDDSGKKE